MLIDWSECLCFSSQRATLGESHRKNIHPKNKRKITEKMRTPKPVWFLPLLVMPLLSLATDLVTIVYSQALSHTLSVLCSIPPEQQMKQKKKNSKDIKIRKSESIKSDTTSDNLSEPVPNNRR